MSGGRWPSRAAGSGGKLAPRRRLPAYAADALQLRAGGMAVRLLVIGLDHFNAGRGWQTIRGSLRVVVPPDVKDVSAMDWSVAAGLDVLVDHWPAPADSEAGAVESYVSTVNRRDALLIALAAVPVQSLWLVTVEDGLEVARRIELTEGSAVLSAAESASIRALPQALDDLHDAQLVMGEGIFGSPEAVPARIDRLSRIFGSDEAGLQCMANALGVSA